MRLTNYVPPRPYAGISKASDRMKWFQTILGAILVVAFIGAGLFVWGWIERQEDQRVSSRIINHGDSPAIREVVRKALK